MATRPLATSDAPLAIGYDERLTQANIQHVDNPRRGASYVQVTLENGDVPGATGAASANRRSIGALSVHRKWECCRLLPVLVGAQSRRSPALL